MVANKQGPGPKVRTHDLMSPLKELKVILLNFWGRAECT